MSHEDVAYFERRAEAELEMARRSQSFAAVQAHYQLANAYLEKIHGEAAANAAQAEPEITAPL